MRKCGNCYHFWVKPDEIALAQHAPHISECQPGKPPDATHKADSVGHNNKSQPAGRFQRMRSKYKLIFSRME